MASPARGPIAEDKNAWWKTPLLAGIIAVVLSLITYSFGAIKTYGGDEKTIQVLNDKINTKVDKEKYETDMVWIKETLKDIKTDVKDIKKGEKQ